jgi:hypothetical protein
MTDTGFGYYAALVLGGLCLSALIVCIAWGIGWAFWKLVTPNKKKAK